MPVKLKGKEKTGKKERKKERRKEGRKGETNTEIPKRQTDCRVISR
jgi:hypothetical protein